LIADSNGVSSASISKEQSRTKQSIHFKFFSKEGKSYVSKQNIHMCVCVCVCVYLYKHIQIFTWKECANIIRFAFILLMYWPQACIQSKGSNWNQWI
jgi:hypothetical protein